MLVSDQLDPLYTSRLQTVMMMIRWRVRVLKRDVSGNPQSSLSIGHESSFARNPHNLLLQTQLLQIHLQKQIPKGIGLLLLIQQEK